MPQGTRLVAHFYIIFINDIFDENFNGNIQFYADDITITYSTHSIQELNMQMQEDAYAKTLFWKKSVTYQCKKTTFIIYRNKNLNNETFKIRYMGTNSFHLNEKCCK